MSLCRDAWTPDTMSDRRLQNVVATHAVTLKAVAVMVLWAACFPLITTGLSLAPHLTFAAMRAFIAGVALVATALVLGRSVPSGWKTWLLLALAGVGATTLGFLGMFHAAEYLAPGIATVIANTQPLLAAVLAYLVLGERLGVSGMTGLAVGLTGIAVIAAPGFTSQNSNDDYILGIAYVLLAAVGITVSNVAFKRLAGTVDALMAAGTQLLIGMIPLILIATITEAPSEVNWSVTFVFVLFGLALPGTAIAYWLWLSVLETLPLNRANAYTFLVPVFGLAIGIGLYGEALTASVVLGASLTLLGIVAVNRSKHTVTNASIPQPELDPSSS